MCVTYYCKYTSDAKDCMRYTLNTLASLYHKSLTLNHQSEATVSQRLIRTVEPNSNISVGTLPICVNVGAAAFLPSVLICHIFL